MSKLSDREEWKTWQGGRGGEKNKFKITFNAATRRSVNDSQIIMNDSTKDECADDTQATERRVVIDKNKTIDNTRGDGLEKNNYHNLLFT